MSIRLAVTSTGGLKSTGYGRWNPPVYVDSVKAKRTLQFSRLAPRVGPGEARQCELVKRVGDAVDFMYPSYNDQMWTCKGFFLIS